MLGQRLQEMCDGLFHIHLFATVFFSIFLYFSHWTALLFQKLVEQSLYEKWRQADEEHCPTMSALDCLPAQHKSQTKKHSLGQGPLSIHGMGFQRTPTDSLRIQAGAINNFEPVWSKNFGTELYDHGKDAEENTNRAHYPSILLESFVCVCVSVCLGGCPFEFLFLWISAACSFHCIAAQLVSTPNLSCRHSNSCRHEKWKQGRNSYASIKDELQKILHAGWRDGVENAWQGREIVMEGKMNVSNCKKYQHKTTFNNKLNFNTSDLKSHVRIIRRHIRVC